MKKEYSETKKSFNITTTYSTITIVLVINCCDKLPQNLKLNIENIY